MTTSKRLIPSAATGPGSNAADMSHGVREPYGDPLGGEVSSMHASSAWHPPVMLDQTGVESFDGVARALRAVQSAFVNSRPSLQLGERLKSQLCDIALELAGCEAEPADRISGRLRHIPGSGQTLVPPVFFDQVSATRISGAVTFERFYLGGGEAVHGGALPLLFDHIFGSLAQAGGQPKSRTAFLHVNYRKITPVERPLQLIATIKSHEGRKVSLNAALMDGDDLLADAEALLVILNPGQP